MDIYSILSSKPHNPHYLNKYITFIEKCQQNNATNEDQLEKHHICPKAKDMFPEYKCLKEHSWNLCLLSQRQHIIAHIILYKAYPRSRSCLSSVWYMSRGKYKSYYSSVFEKIIRKNYSKQQSNFMKVEKKGTFTAIDSEGKFISVSIDDQRYTNGEINGACKGTVIVKDNTGKNFRVSKDDTRLKSGELKGVNFGKVVIRDYNGRNMLISTSEYYSGDYRSLNKDTIWITDGNNNKMIPNTAKIPFGWKEGITRKDTNKTLSDRPLVKEIRELSKQRKFKLGTGWYRKSDEKLEEIKNFILELPLP
jgi:hypothetical protein